MAKVSGLRETMNNRWTLLMLFAAFVGVRFLFPGHVVFEMNHPFWDMAIGFTSTSSIIAGCVEFCKIAFES